MFMRVAIPSAPSTMNAALFRTVTETEPQRLSFVVAAAMELEAETKQELLELRSTSERLDRLRDFLARVVKNYEERARLHTVAKGNGHGGKHVDFE